MIKRYNFEVTSQFKITDQAVYVEARPSKNGKYVLHTDYAALRTHHNALVEAVKKIKKYARHYPDCNESESPFCQCGLEAASAEVDRLLAEGRDELNPLMEEAKRSHITKTMEEGK